MKSKKGSKDGFRPFTNLKSLLAAQRKKDKLELKARQAPPQVKISYKPSSPEEQDCSSQGVNFKDVVGDVHPLTHNKITPPAGARVGKVTIFKEENTQAKEALNRLIQQGEGFHVEQTSEYMDGAGYRIHPEISKRLHKGEFSIQAYLDLHGMDRYEAEEVFDEFMQECLQAGKRAVLIIHGRGLSSPGKPVLKTKVFEWLTRGPWRKWVIAYSSARPVDGGPGATYVLLRKNPATKRARKGSKMKCKHEFSP